MNKIFTGNLVIKGGLENKAIFKASAVCLLLVFLLCSCGKNAGSVYDGDGVEQSDGAEQGNATEQSDEINENVKNAEDGINPEGTLQPDPDEEADKALSKTLEKAKALTAHDDVEASKLFSIGNTHYIKVKINGLMLDHDNVEKDDGTYTATAKYTDRDIYGSGKASGDYYEIWRYENNDLKRILYNMKEVSYNQDDDKINIEGVYNSYIIKKGADDKDKEKVLYECYYTDILNNGNSEFTCYINGFFSVCVVDNKSNQIILNKYIDDSNEFSEENFILDNDRPFLPSKFLVTQTGWIKDSNMAYFACNDIINIYYIVDIDKKTVFQPCFGIGASYEGFIDKDNGYIITGDTGYALDTYTYMMDNLKKQNYYFYLINLYTSEKFQIAKSIKTGMNPKKEDDRTISYLSGSGERVKVDISDMTGKNRVNIRKGFKEMLSSELSSSGLYEIELAQLVISNDKYYQTVKEHLNGDKYKELIIKLI